MNTWFGVRCLCAWGCCPSRASRNISPLPPRFPMHWCHNFLHSRTVCLALPLLSPSSPRSIVAQMHRSLVFDDLALDSVGHEARRRDVSTDMCTSAGYTTQRCRQGCETRAKNSHISGETSARPLRSTKYGNHRRALHHHQHGPLGTTSYARSSTGGPSSGKKKYV